MQPTSANNTLRQTVSLILIAYIFSIAIRMIWVYQFNTEDSFYWMNQLMINTNDGYFFASGAQKVLEEMHQFNPRVPAMFDYGVVFFTVLAAKVLPFSLDTIILYMPTVISSLVVIPIFLIGRLYGNTMLGFAAALLGSIAWSYYNRTMTGYYDTDMFSAMAPMFILYFLMASIKTEKPFYMLLAALSILVYPFLYDSGLSIVYAMGLIYFTYMVIFHRQDDFTYHSIILISIALMGIHWGIKLILITALYLLLLRVSLQIKQLMIISGLFVLAFLVTGNVFTLIWGKIASYAIRGTETEGLHFFQVAQTVREAGRIPFEVMANRISGSVPGILAALAGYVILVIRHKPFILALPLIGIGLFSLWGGLRFTVYAVPVAAISAIYLIYYITAFMKQPILRHTAFTLLTILMLFPNISHIIDYKVPTVFNNQEVTILNNLKEKGSSEDYVITWWDYGYPIWYYTNKNTLIDGGKHNHDNFIVSRILTTSSQLEAARLSRIATETYIESGYKIIADTLFKNHQAKPLNVTDYLDALRYDDITLPEKTHDIYFYLPLRMLDIFPTVQLFSNRDLNTGEKHKRPFFYSTRYFKEDDTVLQLGNGIAMLQKEGMLQVGNQKIPINSFYRTLYNKDGKLQINRQPIVPGGQLSVIYMANYNRFLIVDDHYLNSTYIQLFVFENYDKTLFEPVIMGPLSKVYRLKQ